MHLTYHNDDSTTMADRPFIDVTQKMLAEGLRQLSLDRAFEDDAVFLMRIYGAMRSAELEP